MITHSAKETRQQKQQWGGGWRQQGKGRGLHKILKKKKKKKKKKKLKHGDRQYNELYTK